MKKKLFLLLLTVALTLGITYGEYLYIQNQLEEKPEQTVIFLSQAIKKGELFTKDNLVAKSMMLSDVETSYVTSMDEVLNSYSSENLSKGSLLLNTHIKSSDTLTLASDQSLIWITFEFSGETSNGWNLRENQFVKLLYSPKDGSDYKVYEEVVVKRIYDKNVIEQSEGEEQLKYVTFEIKALEGYELIAKRDDGRVEIIIL